MRLISLILLLWPACLIAQEKYEGPIYSECRETLKPVYFIGKKYIESKPITLKSDTTIIEVSILHPVDHNRTAVLRINSNILYGKMGFGFLYWKKGILETCKTTYGDEVNTIHIFLGQNGLYSYRDFFEYCGDKLIINRGSTSFEFPISSKTKQEFKDLYQCILLSDIGNFY